MSASSLLIASDYWFCTLDGFGRRGCAADMAGLGAAAALLGEQLLLNTVAIEGGNLAVYSPVPPACADELARHVHRTVSCGPQPAEWHLRGKLFEPVDCRRDPLTCTRQDGLCRRISEGRADKLAQHTLNEFDKARDVIRVGDWLELLRHNAYDLVAARLHRAKLVQRTLIGRYRPVDPNVAATPASRLTGQLRQRRPEYMKTRDVLLAGLVDATSLGRRVFDDHGPEAMAFLHSRVASLPPWEQELIRLTRNAADELARMSVH